MKFLEKLETYLKRTSPIYQALNGLDSLNNNIDEEVRKKIEATDSGKKTLRAAEILESTQRTLGGAASDVTRETFELAELLADKTNLYNFNPEQKEKTEQFVAELASIIYGPESVEMVQRGDKKVAKIKEPEYAGGEIVRDLTALGGSIIGGTKGIDKLGKVITKTKPGNKLATALENIPKTRNFAKNLLAGETAVQISVNPYEARLADLLGEFVSDDQKTLKNIITYLEADENKTELENRIGLGLEGLVVSAALPVAIFGSKSIKETFKNKDTIIQALRNVKDDYKKGSLDIKGFKEILINSSRSAPEMSPTLKEIPEDTSKLWQFSSNKLKRKISTFGLERTGFGAQDFFGKRGYFTPKTFELFNSSENAKKAWNESAELFGNKIDRKMLDISNKYKKYKDVEKLKLDVNDVLKGEKDISTLPRELRKDIEDYRNLTDDFSEIIVQMPNTQISKELKESINSNKGKWLHTSYEIFESSEKASQKFKSFEAYRKAVMTGDKDALAKLEDSRVFGNAVEELNLLNKDLKKYKNLSGSEKNTTLTKDSLDKIYKMLKDTTDKNGANNYFSRMDGFYGSGRSMFKRKADLGDAMKELLGEIKDPSYNIFKSTSQVAGFIEDSRFTSDFYNSLKGRTKRKAGSLQDFKVGSGHIFTGDNVVIDDVTGIKYDTQLKGKKYGVLDGKWMTKEMAMMFQERQGILNALDKSDAYKIALFLKGLGQASKTVLNHITHARNFLGGVWFTASNGNNPFSNISNNIGLIYNRRFAGRPDEDKLSYFNKLTSYGITSNSAVMGQIENLFKDASTFKTNNKFFNNVINTIQDNTKFIQKFGRGAQDVYVGTDDLFKIISYEQELDSLLKAAKNSKFKSGDKTISYNQYIKENPNYLETLEREAARITLDTVPNYSFVPTGIKQLRKLPVGNYFSFPAEIARTSTNIVYQGTKELFLGNNPVTKLKGAKRLGGFFAMGMFGSEGLSRFSKHFFGVSEDEEQQLRFLNSADYEKNSKFIFIRDEQGKVYKNDFSFIDPYDSIKRPLRTAMINFAHGEKTQENLDKIFKETIVEASTEYLKPFVSSPIAVQALKNIRSGETEEGYNIKGLSTAASPGERIATAFNEVYKVFSPGGAPAVPKMTKAVRGDDYKTWMDGKAAVALETIAGVELGDKDYEVWSEVLANTTGIRFEVVDVERDFRKKTKKYKRQADDARQRITKFGVGRDKTLMNLVEETGKANGRHYYAWKDLSLAYQAAQYFNIDQNTLKDILKEEGIGTEAINTLPTNNYHGIRPGEETLKNATKVNRLTYKGESFGKLEAEYYIDQMLRTFESVPVLDITMLDEYTGDTPLENVVPRDTLELLRKPPKGDELLERVQKVTGGIIKTDDNIPRVKENPANRINPLTGNPYIEEQMKELGLE
tara:strand:+ start:3802 stop:8016 length:4215 start_codon:yes stop_codon:yes gene_type:complete